MTTISKISDMERKQVVQSLKESLENNTPWHFHKKSDMARIWNFIYDELVRMTIYDSLIEPKSIFKLEFSPAKKYLVVSAHKRRSTAMMGFKLHISEEKIIKFLTRAIHHYGLEIKEEVQPPKKPSRYLSYYEKKIFTVYAKDPPKNEFKIEE